jgi:hypothetical protein
MREFWDVFIPAFIAAFLAFLVLSNPTLWMQDEIAQCVSVTCLARDLR